MMSALFSRFLLNERFNFKGLFGKKSAINKIFQARQSLEKAKVLLEEERQNLTSELKSLQTGRMESERGRKRAESQLQEFSTRLAQADREREDREERVQKLQVLKHGNTLKSTNKPRIKSGFPSEGMFWSDTCLLSSSLVGDRDCIQQFVLL